MYQNQREINMHVRKMIISELRYFCRLSFNRLCKIIVSQYKFNTALKNVLTKRDYCIRNIINSISIALL